MRLSLQQLQTLLYELITTLQPEECISDGCGQAFEEVETLICGDGRLSPAGRINVYANAYSYRLLECLREEFPATLAVVGPDNFSTLVQDYLLVWHPTKPSIFYAGRH